MRSASTLLVLQNFIVQAAHLDQHGHLVVNGCLLPNGHGLMEADVLHDGTLAAELLVQQLRQLIPIVYAAPLAMRPVHDSHDGPGHVVQRGIPRDPKAGSHPVPEAFHVLCIWRASSKVWAAEEEGPACSVQDLRRNIHN